jgi:tight adherence protein B
MALLYSLLFGVAVFILANHYMVRVLDWFRFQSLGTRDYIVEKCNQMFIEITPQRALLYMILGSVVPFILTFLYFLPSVIPGLALGLILAVGGWFAPRPIIDFMYRSRIDKFNLQMVDGLGLMSNAMKSGLSVVQALGVVVEQMPNPMSQEFNLVLSENKVGVSIEEAFNNLARRIKCEDVEMFVTSINILKETGGNLAETFDTIAFTVRERLKVENKIKALTAQGFYQGMILLSIPPALCVYFSVSDPEFMRPMFENWLGWVVLGGVIFLEVIAFFVIKRVIRVDV